MDPIKIINFFFFNQIDDYSKQSRLSGYLVSLTFTKIITLFFFIFNEDYTLTKYIWYDIMLFINLMLIKYHKEDILQWITLFNWILIPYIAIQNNESIIRNISLYIISPSIISLCHLPKKFYLVIALSNLLLISIKSLKDQSDATIILMKIVTIEIPYQTLLILIVCSWLIGIIHMLRFEDISMRYEDTSHDLQRSNINVQNLMKDLEEKDKELTKCQLNLKNELKSKDHMLAKISHELRNSLNILYGNIDLILNDKVKIPKEHIERLEISRLCGYMFMNSINNLIDASKIAADTLYLNNNGTDFFELLDTIWKINCLKIKQKNLKAELFICKKCPKYIDIDEQRVMQILLNLSSNSIKFTEKGNIKILISWHENESFDNVTKLDVALAQQIADVPKFNQDLERIDINNQVIKECKESLIQMSEFNVRCNKNEINIPKLNCLQNIDYIQNHQFHVFGVDQTNVSSILNEKFIHDPRKITLSNMFGTLKIEIIDTGCGIDSKLQKKILQSLEQENRIDTGKYGTGLGLFIIKKLVNKMGGIFKLYSQKYFGTNFTVAFPCNKSEVHMNSQSSPENIIPIVSHKGKKALIAEDDPCNLKLINDYLDKMGIESISCSNGNDAYSRFKEEGLGYFSFITLDIQMPELDGIATAKLIRNYENRMSSTPVPILFITGNNQEKDIKQYLEPNGSIRTNFFLRKPLRFGDFQNILDNASKKNRYIKKRFNILVVDDDYFNVDVIAANLDNKNLDFERASNGAEALSKVTLKRNCFDFIFMDCDMPIMDGITATKKIITYLISNDLNKITIIGMTGHSDQKKLEECIDAGMMKVFCKPFSIASLIDFIFN